MICEVCQTEWETTGIKDFQKLMCPRCQQIFAVLVVEGKAKTVEEAASIVDADSVNRINGKILADLGKRIANQWEPNTAPYDRAIHTNPDARAWADFFMATFPNCGADRDTMTGWFANAMMAVRDSSNQKVQS